MIFLVLDLINVYFLSGSHNKIWLYGRKFLGQTIKLNLISWLMENKYIDFELTQKPIAEEFDSSDQNQKILRRLKYE